MPMAVWRGFSFLQCMDWCSCCNVSNWICRIWQRICIYICICICICIFAMYGLVLLLQYVKLDLPNLATDLYLIIRAIQSPISPYKGLKLTIWSNCKTITPHPSQHVFQTNQPNCLQIFWTDSQYRQSWQDERNRKEQVRMLCFKYAGLRFYN